MALTVREYLTADGRNPFREWLGSLTKADKGSQAKDIARAQGFWRDLVEAKRHGKTK
jgi:hypothetical protein